MNTTGKSNIVTSTAMRPEINRERLKCLKRC